MTARIFIKLILGVVGVVALALLAVDYLVTQRVKASFFASLERELTEKAQLIAQTLPRPEADFAKLAQGSSARVTWPSARNPSQR